MSVELISVLIAVLAVGATLARVILTSSRGLRQDMARMTQRCQRRHPFPKMGDHRPALSRPPSK